MFHTYILPILLGVGATIFVFLAKDFFYRSFLPRYKEWTSRGHTIAGKWNTTFPARHDEKLVCNEFISMRQLSEKVWGVIHYTEIRSSDNKIVREKHFEFEGTFVDSVLSAAYNNTDRRDKGRGTFCLASTHANTLVGKYSLFDPDTNKVEADDYIWKRKY